MHAPEHHEPVGPGSIVRERWDLLAVIALGGALGSVARWGVAEAMPYSGSEFPWATFAVNVIGAFALGVLTTLVSDVWPQRRYLRPFVGAGVLGGFTTFSTYVLDARGAYAAGTPAVALGSLLLTFVVALPAAWAGLWLTRRIIRRRTGEGAR